MGETKTANTIHVDKFCNILWEKMFLFHLSKNLLDMSTEYPHDLQKVRNIEIFLLLISSIDISEI